MGTYGHGIVRSTDDGNSWNRVTTTPVEPFVFRLTPNGHQFFSGTESGFFLSSDAGAGWTCVDSSLPAFSFLPIGDTVIAGLGHGVSRSTDAGATWTYTPFAPHNNLYALATNGENVYAGAYDGLYASSDFGLSWQHIAFSDTTIWSMACSHGNLLVSTSRIDGMGHAGGYCSTDGGTTWTRNDTLNATSFYAADNFVLNVFYSWGFGSFVGASVDGGITWRDITGNLPAGCYDIAANNTYAFVAGAFGVFRRPLSQILTSVHEAPDAEMPHRLLLAQNYPNPFNPTTTIEFSLPKDGFMSLKVYNIVGEEVAILVSQEMKAGTFRTQWDAGHVASGVYFYRLATASSVQTKKLIVTK